MATYHPAGWYCLGLGFSSRHRQFLLKSYIEISAAVPPDYSLISLSPAGLQCSTWPLVALNQIGIVPSTLLPQMVPFIDSLIWNPLTVSLMISISGAAGTDCQERFRSAWNTQGFP